MRHKGETYEGDIVVVVVLVVIARKWAGAFAAVDTIDVAVYPPVCCLAYVAWTDGATAASRLIIVGECGVAGHLE